MHKLTEIANKHYTDKGSLCHGYTEIYPKYLPENPKKIFEIGIHAGGSIRMWNEYYPNLECIYGLDFHPTGSTLNSYKQIQAENKKYKFFYGDQSNREHLDNIATVIGDEQLDFLLDDGSHNVDDQQITLARLLKTVKSKGLYIVEDMADKIYPQGGWNIKDMVNYSDATVNVLDNFIQTGKFETPYLSEEEKTYLENTIDKVVLELRQDHNFAVIYKK